MKRLLVVALLLGSCRSAPPKAVESEPAPQSAAATEPKPQEAPSIRPLLKAETPQATTLRDPELFAIDAACQKITDAVGYGLQIRRQRIESDPTYREEATKTAYYLVLGLQESNNTLARKAKALNRFKANKATLVALSRKVQQAREGVANLHFDDETVRRIDDGILELTNTLR